MYAQTIVRTIPYTILTTSGAHRITYTIHYGMLWYEEISRDTQEHIGRVCIVLGETGNNIYYAYIHTYITKYVICVSAKVIHRPSGTILRHPTVCG